MLRRLHGFISPLRYPGGKGALANFMKLLIQQNDLQDGNYVEVYAGGAGIAWSLLVEEYVRHVHVNDLSLPVYSFWHSVLFHTDELCRLVRDRRVSMSEWRRQRAIMMRPGDHTVVELGFSAFFLNRTNRSGILAGGVIGGKRQDGQWKLDARFNKRDLTSRIERIARYASRVSLHNLDAAEFLTSVLPTLPHKTLVYLDPPYFSRGQDLYESHYSKEDHAHIARLVTQCVSLPWVVSYDSAPEVSLLYSGFEELSYRLSYSAQSRYAGTETMRTAPNSVDTQLSEFSQLLLVLGRAQVAQS